MKLLQGCILVLVIIILIPIAASCAGISLLAIGTAPIIDQAIGTPEPPTGPAPTVPPRLPDSPGGGDAPLDPAIFGRGREITDDALAEADALLAVADDVLATCDPDAGDVAYDACLEAYDDALADYDAGVDHYERVFDCVDRAESMVAVEACGDH